MIRSFACRDTGALFHRQRSRRLGGIERQARRINDQWRLCFVWTPAGPQEVEIVDYH
jgi:hypothetical protein